MHKCAVCNGILKEFREREFIYYYCSECDLKYYVYDTILWNDPVQERNYGNLEQAPDELSTFSTFIFIFISELAYYLIFH